MSCRTFLLSSVLAAVAVPFAVQAAPANGAEANGTVSFRYDAEQVRALQRRLNLEGFSSGHVDGAWGPITSKAVMEYQRKAGLQATGRLDVATLQALGLPAAEQPATAAVSPPAAAQAQRAPASSATVPAVPVPPPPVQPPAVAAVQPSNAATASQGAAADTVGTGRAEPTPGANSFTEGEARRRIEGHGYAGVGALHKGGDGVWRGSATKDGQQVSVWLDYQGDVGRRQ